MEKEAIGFGGPQLGSGRPRNAKVSGEIRDRIDAEADQLFAVFLEATEAVTADGRPDHAIRLKAANALLDRAYGKPRLAEENSITMTREIPEIPETPERLNEVVAILREVAAIE